MFLTSWISAFRNPASRTLRSQSHRRHSRAGGEFGRKPKTFAPACEKLEDRTLLAPVSWVSNTDGFWDVGANWSTGNPPAAADDVTIDVAADITVTVRDFRRINTIQGGDAISIVAGGELEVDSASTYDGTIGVAGILDVDAVLTTNGPVNWTDGTIDAAAKLNIPAGTTMTISGATAKTLTGAAGIDLAGTIEHTGDGNVNTVVSTGGFFILAGGLYDLQSDADITGAGDIDNSGTFRKSAGAGESLLDLDVDNTVDGTIEVQTGQVTIIDNGSRSTGGTFNVSAGAVLDLTGGFNMTYEGTYTGSGTGQIQFAAGDINTAGTGLTFNFDAGLFYWTGGELRAAASRPFTNIGFVQLSGAGDRTVFSTGFNEGTIVHSGSGNFILSGSVFTNQAGALYDLQSDGDITGSSDIVNFGTFRKSAGVGESIVTSVDFEMRPGSTVDVQTGQLTLAGGGTSTGGAFTVSPGAVLDLTGGGSPTFEGTYTGTGGGTVQVAGGILSTAGTGATFDLPGDMFQWTGGRISSIATRPFTIADQMNISGDGIKQIDAVMINQGTVIHSGAGLVDNVSAGAGSRFENLPGALYHFTGAGMQDATNFNNQGTVRKTGASEAQFTDALNNLGGTVDVQSGQLTFAGTGSSSTGGTFNVQPAAVLDLTGGVSGGGAPVYAGTYTGSGGGRVQFAGGELRPNAMVIDFPVGMFHWSGGLFRGTSVLTLTNTEFMQISGTDGKTIGSINLINQGTVIQTDASMISHTIDGSQKLITNDVGGLFDMQGELGTSASVTINNLGTFRKSGSTTEALIGGKLDSDGGTFEVLAGQLNVGGGGTQRDSQYDIAAGATFAVTRDGIVNNFLDLAGSLTGTGTGTFEILGGAIRGDSSDPAVFDFVDGLFQWVGSLGITSLGTLVNDGHITLVGTDPVEFRGILTNRGTMRLEGSFFDLGQTSFFINDGLFDFAGDGDFGLIDFGGIGSAFHNNGIIRKSAGTGTSEIDGLDSAHHFSNTGTIESQIGTLLIGVPIEQFDNSTLTGGTWNALDGTIDVVSAASITTNQGHVTLSGPGSVFAPIDAIDTNSGSLSILDGRDFSTAGDLTNGATRLETSYGLFHPSLGRLVGIAFDAASGNLFVHPSSLSTIHEFTPTEREVAPSIPRPGAASTHFDLDFVSAALDVGGVVVPAGSLLALSGQTAPPTVFALDKDTGVELASVQLAVPTFAVGVAYHVLRGTLFVMERTGDQIHEINAADGSVLNSFTIRPVGQPFFDINFGDLEVDGTTGNLLVVGSIQNAVRELTPTGGFVQDVDLDAFGIRGLSGIARDDATGDLWLASETGEVYHFTPFQFGQFGQITVGVDSTLTVNGVFTEDSTNTLNIIVGGSPASGLFGRVDSTDTANLLGNLNIELAQGFSPTPGDSYTIMTFPDRVGTFNDITGDDPFFTVDVQNTAVVLNAQLGSGIDLNHRARFWDRL